MRLLADTSVWIDHIRKSDATFAIALRDVRVLMHSAVIGEIALASVKAGDRIVADFGLLPEAEQADDSEVLRLVHSAGLGGRGIGWVDAHLLASAMLSGAQLLTRDRRLAAVAGELGVGAAL